MAKLYKFRSWNDENQKRILTHRELWFASPRSFNDPFDCRIPLRYDLIPKHNRFGVLNSLLRQDFDTRQERRRRARQLSTHHPLFESTPENWVEYYRRHLEQHYGVLSFAEERDNMLLWSHYSDSHRGFCVEFDQEVLDRYFDDLFRGNTERYVIRPFRVKYDDKYPDMIPNRDTIPTLIDTALTFKSSEWKYEKEWRYIWSKHVNKALPFLENVVSGVYVGCLATQTQRQAMIAAVRSSLPHVTIYQATTRINNFALSYRAIAPE